MAQTTDGWMFDLVIPTHYLLVTWLTGDISWPAPTNVDKLVLVLFSTHQFARCVSLTKIQIHTNSLKPLHGPYLCISSPVLCSSNCCNDFLPSSALNKNT